MLQQVLHGFGQVGEALAGEAGSGPGAGFLASRVAIDEDGMHAEAAAELNVGERIADHGAGLGGDVREIGLSLLEQARQRLAAVALAVVVRAEVEGVQMRSGLLQQGLQFRLDCQHIRGGVQAEGDATLV